MMKNLMMPFTFLLLYCFPCLITSNQIPTNTNIKITAFEKLRFPPNVHSTGGLTFDSSNGGPYIGAIDGRVLKYNKRRKIFEDFAYTSVERSRAFCDGTSDINRIQICGFPSSLSTDYLSRKIYISDSTLGLKVVGTSGGLATTLVPSRDGVPYHALTAVGAATNHKVYYVDASSVYNLKGINISIQTRDFTGKFFQYDTRTKEVTTLLTKLGVPAGVSSDRDATSVFVSEYTGRRVIKYYLKGRKAGTAETFLPVRGNPFQISRVRGEDNFWVAINNVINETYSKTDALKFNTAGEILAILNLNPEFTNLVATVVEQDNELFVAAVNTTYAGKYKLVRS